MAWKSSKYIAGEHIELVRSRDTDNDISLCRARFRKHFAVGTDAAKNTFVRLYGLEECEQLVQRYTAAALDTLSAFEDNEYLIDLAKSLTDRKN